MHECTDFSSLCIFVCVCVCVYVYVCVCVCVSTSRSRVYHVINVAKIYAVLVDIR